MQNIWIIIVALSSYTPGYKTPPAIHQAVSQNFINQKKCENYLTNTFYTNLESKNSIKYEVIASSSHTKIIVSSHKGYDNNPMQLIYKCMEVVTKNK